jgi:hypothetical protein
MQTKLTPLTLALVLVVTLPAYAAAQPQTKPNIVFVSHPAHRTPMYLGSDDFPRRPTACERK